MLSARPLLFSSEAVAHIDSIYQRHSERIAFTSVDVKKFSIQIFDHRARMHTDGRVDEFFFFARANNSFGTRVARDFLRTRKTDSARYSNI